MTMLVAGMFYGMLMLAAGVAIGEVLCARRHHDCPECSACPVDTEGHK